MQAYVLPASHCLPFLSSWRSLVHVLVTAEKAAPEISRPCSHAMPAVVPAAQGGCVLFVGFHTDLFEVSAR